MADYTTPEDVLDETPGDIPAETQAKIPGWITAESRYIDASLPGYATPFKATPSTPATIEKIARFLVLDRVFRRCGLLRYDAEGRLVDSYRAEAEKTLRQLRDGEIVIPASQL